MLDQQRCVSIILDRVHDLSIRLHGNRSDYNQELTVAHTDVSVVTAVIHMAAHEL